MKINKKMVFYILSLVLAIACMAIVFSLISRVVKDDLSSAAIFLGVAFLCEAGFNGILFFRFEDKKNRIRLSLMVLFFIIAAIFGFISTIGHYFLFSISIFIFIIALAISRLLSIDKNKKLGWNVTNILCAILFFLMSFVTFLNDSDEKAKAIILIAAFILLFMSFHKLVLPTLNFEKVKILINILSVTHTIDVLVCLLALMIAFSFIFPLVETNINNFWDAIWYCFAVITTIGFGDFAATSAVGRILTVILGLYGIVVVAVLTSVIVNFYNAVSDKSSEKEMDKIVKEVVEKRDELEKPRKRSVKK